MKKLYLFFSTILLSIQSFGWQYEYCCSAHYTNETTSNFRQWIYSPSDFAAVSPSGNILAVYMKASSGNPIANLTVKMGAKHTFNTLNLKS